MSSMIYSSLQLLFEMFSAMNTQWVTVEVRAEMGVGLHVKADIQIFR
jgi:hypothetical protein